MRKPINPLRKRPRPEIRPQHLPIPKEELEEIWRRAWIEAGFRRIGL